MINVNIAAYLLIPGPLLAIVYWKILGKAGITGVRMALSLLPMIPWLLKSLPDLLVRLDVMEPTYQTLTTADGKDIQVVSHSPWIDLVFGWLPGLAATAVIFLVAIFPLLYLALSKWPERQS